MAVLKNAQNSSYFREIDQTLRLTWVVGVGVGLHWIEICQRLVKNPVPAEMVLSWLSMSDWGQLHLSSDDLSENRKKQDLKKSKDQFHIISVVEFQKWWVLKSKTFSKESTYSKEIVSKQSCNELWFVKKCWNCTFKVNFLCQKSI